MSKDSLSSLRAEWRSIYDPSFQKEERYLKWLFRIRFFILVLVILIPVVEYVSPYIFWWSTANIKTPVNTTILLVTACAIAISEGFRRSAKSSRLEGELGRRQSFWLGLVSSSTLDVQRKSLERELTGKPSPLDKDWYTKVESALSDIENLAKDAYTSMVWTARLMKLKTTGFFGEKQNLVFMILIPIILIIGLPLALFPTRRYSILYVSVVALFIPVIFMNWVEWLNYKDRTKEVGRITDEFHKLIGEYLSKKSRESEQEFIFECLRLMQEYSITLVEPLDTEKYYRKNWQLLEEEISEHIKELFDR